MEREGCGTVELGIICSIFLLFVYPEYTWYILRMRLWYSTVYSDECAAWWVSCHFPRVLRKTMQCYKKVQLSVLPDPPLPVPPHNPGPIFIPFPWGITLL